MIRFWHKFNQVVRSNICKGVDTMCNLSQGIVDRAKERMLNDFVMNMYKNKFSLEQISLATTKSIDEVKRIIEEHEAVLV